MKVFTLVFQDINGAGFPNEFFNERFDVILTRFYRGQIREFKTPAISENEAKDKILKSFPILEKHKFVCLID